MENLQHLLLGSIKSTICKNASEVAHGQLEVSASRPHQAAENGVREG